MLQKFCEGNTEAKMSPKKFSLNKISKQLKNPWRPITIAKVDNYTLKIAKFKDDYHWHKHENNDELFIVIKGKIKIQTRSGNITLKEGEGIKITKNIEHCPIAIEPSIVLMFEPLKLKSKGNATNVTDTFGKLKRKTSGQQFKDKARAGW